MSIFDFTDYDDEKKKKPSQIAKEEVEKKKSVSGVFDFSDYKPAKVETKVTPVVEQPKPVEQPKKNIFQKAKDLFTGALRKNQPPEKPTGQAGLVMDMMNLPEENKQRALEVAKIKVTEIGKSLKQGAIDIGKSFTDEFGAEVPRAKEFVQGKITYSQWHKLASDAAIQKEIENLKIKQEESYSSKDQKEIDRLQNLVNDQSSDAFTIMKRNTEVQKLTNKRMRKGVVSGALDSGASMLDGVSWLAKDNEGISYLADKSSDKVKAWADELRSENPQFSDQLAQGTGSALTFFVPGLGVGKLTTVIAKVSPRIALYFASSSAAALEAMSEAGSVYDESVTKGMSKDEASKKATNVFWLNSVLIGITNKLGIFGDNAASLKKLLMSGTSEGFQEYSQQVISNVNTDKPWDEGAFESGVYGAIIGGGLGSITDAGVGIEPIKQDAEVIKQIQEKENIIDETVTPVTGQAAEEETPVVPGVVEEVKPKEVQEVVPAKTEALKTIVEPSEAGKVAKTEKEIKMEGGLLTKTPEYDKEVTLKYPKEVQQFKDWMNSKPEYQEIVKKGSQAVTNYENSVQYKKLFSLLKQDAPELAKLVRGKTVDTFSVAFDTLKSTLPKEVSVKEEKPQITAKPTPPLSPTKVVPPVQAQKIVPISEQLILSPTIAVKPEELLAEWKDAKLDEAMGVSFMNTNKKGEVGYSKPLIGKTDIKTFINNSEEFAKNPVLVVEKGKLIKTPDRYSGTHDTTPKKVLTFKGDKTTFSLIPEALNLNADNLKIGDEIKVNVPAFKKAKGTVQQTRIYKGGKAFASEGMYADLKNLTGEVQKDLKPVEFPELVRMVENLIGEVPSVKLPRFRSSIGGRPSGLFIASGNGKIVLNPMIFKDIKQATKVLAHEIGHLADYLPQHLMSRGNLLGRIASLNRYMKSFLPGEKGGKGELTTKDRARLRREATKMANIPISVEEEVVIGEIKATSEELLAIWNDNTSRIKNPRLLKYIQQLDNRQKVEIAKSAMKGDVPAWVSFRNRIVKTVTKEVIKNAPADIKVLYKKLIREEIEKRNLLYVEDVKDELRRLSQMWKPFNESADPNFTKYRFSPEELYADAISVLLNDPVRLQENAPTFYKGFFSYLDSKPEVKSAFEDVWNLLNKGEEAVFNERNEAMDKAYATAEDSWRAKETEKQQKKTNLLHVVQVLFDDKNAPLNRKYNQKRKEGIQIDDKYNLVSEFAGLNYLDGKLKNFVADNFGEAYKIAHEITGGEEMLGKILQLERSIYERGELANPGGFSPDTAQTQLEGLEKHTDPADWKKIQDAKKLFRTGMENVVKMAEENGYYTPEMLEIMKANSAYATFQVIDYLDLYISSAIKKQVGTLKDVANPATSSIMKAISTMKAIEYNNARTLAVDFHQEMFADEIQPAKTVFDGKVQRVIEPKDKDLGLVTIVRNGKLEGYYVEKELADTINKTSDKTIRAAAKISRIITSSRFYRPLFTSLNLGFQTFNVTRDFMRYWKNIPDKSFKDAILSFPRAFKRYAQAAPHAWNRVTTKPDEIIKSMENSKILGQTFNDTFGGDIDPDEKQIERVLQRSGVLPKTKKRGLLTPIFKLFDGIEVLGNYIETLPKVAAYMELKNIMPEKELAQFVRTKAGSPDFLTSGTFTPISNNIFMFSNAFKEGYKTDIQVATDPKTRGGWWWKTMVSSVLPKVIMMAMAAGLLGDWLKKRMEDASEYDKTNYTIVPIGVDENGKTIYLRLPQDETGRFIGGLTWKIGNMFDGGGVTAQDFFDIFSLGAGQLPNIAPGITAQVAIMSYLSGRNPYDDFRGRTIIPDAEFKAGVKYSLPIFLNWLVKNQGLSIVIPNYVPKGDVTTLEKILNLPVLSNIVGRWVKVSDYGKTEKLTEISTKVDKETAQRNLDQRKMVNNAVKEYTSGELTQERKIQIEKDLVAKVIGTGQLDKKQIEQANALVKKFKIAVIKGSADANTDAIIYATTNAEKVQLLQEIHSTMEEQVFKDFVNGLKAEKIISDDVIIELKKSPFAPEEKKTSLNFNLVKTAFAAEEIRDPAKMLVWTKDDRNKWEKFLGKVQSYIPGEQGLEKPIEGVAADKLNTDEKTLYYRTMLAIRDENPDWYYKNIGNKVEKRILGFDLGSEEAVRKSLQQKVKPQEEVKLQTETLQEEVKSDVIKTSPAPTIQEPEATETPYNNDIKEVFGDKWVEATKILKRTDADGVIRGENTQLLSGKEVDIGNRLDKNGMWDDNAPVATFKNKFTGEVEENVDRGLFRINNVRLFGKNGLLGGKVERPMMIEAGILDESYRNREDITPEMAQAAWDKMLEPKNNIKMAKILYDLNGNWDAWVAAPTEWLSEKRKEELGK